MVSLEAAVSALSSFAGQALIPVPVLGAIMGNTVGILMYKTVASSLSGREAELIGRYLLEQRVLDEQLAIEYQELIETLEQAMSGYLGLHERAFSPDVEIAFRGSVELARVIGVAVEEILHSEEEVFTFFLE
ncbi:UNVERIFIED_ORG: hypothetical protein J3D58_000678 [Paenarthrobacter nicotinovorans]